MGDASRVVIGMDPHKRSATIEGDVPTRPGQKVPGHTICSTDPSRSAASPATGSRHRGSLVRHSARHSGEHSDWLATTGA